MTTAEWDRAEILDRVASAIWLKSWPEGEAPLSWAHATMAAQSKGAVQIASMVEITRESARAAVAALIIGNESRSSDVRMAHAGEHASGLDPRVCVDVFDAMLKEVLE